MADPTDRYAFFSCIYKGDIKAAIELASDPTVKIRSAPHKNGRIFGLHLAIEKQQPLLIHKLLAREDVNVYEEDWLGRTPLQVAKEFGNQEIIGLIMEKNHPYRLKEACDKGDFDLVEKLVDDPVQNVNVKIKQMNNFSLLHYAISRQNVEMVETLLSREDFEPFIIDNEFRVPLSLAKEIGNQEIIDLVAGKYHSHKVEEALCCDEEKMAEKYATDPFQMVNNSELGDFRDAALHDAARLGYTYLAELLLSRDDIMGQPKDEDRYTPLHIAAMNGNIEIVRMLLEHGVDLDSVTVDSETALIFARENKHQEIVDLLLESGARDVDYR